MTTLIGTTPELAVYNALISLGYEGRFSFQSSQMGGRIELGGVVLDFYIPELLLGISVLGEFWHYRRPGQLANDLVRAAALESMGIHVIYIDEVDAMRNARYYVSEALKGNDHSKVARGL